MNTKAVTAPPKTIAHRAPASPEPPEPPELVIEPRSGWRLVDLRELRAYRDLLRYMIWRGIKSRYAQSALGIGWAVGQPVLMMLVYTVIFSRIARIPVPGDYPYALMAFCGIVPWSFFSAAVTNGSNSLIDNNAMLGKIYFPRLILPLSMVMARLVELGISLVVLALLMIGFGVVPGLEALVVVPVMIAVMFTASVGISLWLSAMAVQYRDVAYSLTFLIQIAMYLSPVIYPTELVPARLLPIFGLNPMVGVISGIRASLLGGPFLYHPSLILEGAAVAVVLLLTGALYFRRSERLFADVA